MTGLLTPADILGIANQTDPTRGATEVGYSMDGTPTTVAAFLNEIANGTATPITTATGTETVPASMGSGLKQLTTAVIAQLAINIKNSEVTVPLVATTTALLFAQYNAGIIVFTGTLNANSTVQLPSTSGIWIFVNNTTGAYSLTLATVAMGSTTLLLTQGVPILAYSDGTNVHAVASGGGGGANTLTTYNFVATAGQTQINVNYVPGNIVVSRLGAVLPTSDYVATSGAYIAFNTPLSVGDEVSVLVFGAFSTTGAISVYEFTATAGQTTFNAGYTPGTVEVFRNGAILMSTMYTATNGTSITLSTPTAAGDTIKIISQNSSSVANTVPITGGTFTGPVVVNGTVTSTSGGFVFPDGTTQGSAAMGKNRVINGSCNVAQRPAMAYTFGVTGYSGPDRYYAANSSTAANGQFTQSQGTITYGGLTLNAVVQTVNTAIVTDTTTNYWSGITQKIEGFNCYDLVGQSVVLSFVFNTNVSGTYSVSLQDGTAANSWVATFTAVANTPTRVMIPISMLPLTLTTPNSTSTGLWLWVGALNAGTYQTANLGTWQTGNFISASTATNWGTTAGNFIALTDLQLERGMLATPFENRSYGHELALCRRYYYQITVPPGQSQTLVLTGFITSATSIVFAMVFPQQMRVPPTISSAFLWVTSYNAQFAGTSTTPVGTPTVDSLGFAITATGANFTPGQGGGLYIGNSSTPYTGGNLNFSAEL